MASTLFLSIVLMELYYNMLCPFFQGMSDFLAPILYVMEDESESFWCFASLMERLGANFNRDQNGMQAQLLALSKVCLDSPFIMLSAEQLSSIMLLFFHLCCYVAYILVRT